MGFGMRQKEAEFSLPKKYFSDACEALKKLFGNEDGFVEYIKPRDVIRACDENDFVQAMIECRWRCEVDETGVVGIRTFGNNLGMEYQIFRAIAPYVKEGSVIEMTGDENALWRWRFENGECFEDNGVVYYESDPIYVTTMDWISEGGCGSTVLCVSPEQSRARLAMREQIEEEKKNSWIGDVPPENINSGADSLYIEELSDDAWSFYLRTAYENTHTTITVTEYRE